MRQNRRPGSRQDGVVLLICLIVLVALTASALSLSAATSRNVAAAGREVSHLCSLFAADAGLAAGQAWFRGQRYLGPPARVNEQTIANASEAGFWNTRNWGGIAAADSATVRDWRNVVPDMGLAATGSRTSDVWFQIAFDPDRVVFSNRKRGEEAGRSVSFDYRLSAVSRCPGGSGMTMEQHFAQAYTVGSYD